MKKTLMLFAGLALAATTANAQDVTPAKPKTEVEVRDNGTTKVTTKTGKTNVGAALDNTKDAIGNVARKGGKAVKRGTQKVGSTVKKGTKKMEAKTE